MTLVGFVVHPARPAAIDVAATLTGWLDEIGVHTHRLPEEPLDPAEHGASEASTLGLDLVISVGGDGTFLRAAKAASREQCPVLGVKVGRLGFLTEAEPEEARSLIETFLAGRGLVEERLALEARVEGMGVVAPQWALNEIIVEKQTRHRLIRLAVQVDGEEVTTFSADGVIVSTPTGSTAYSFSARGPIVTPTIGAMIITPIAAHMVFDRSIVLAPSQQVVLEVVPEEPGVLSADGRASVELAVGARVMITAAPEPALLVRRKDGRSFLGVVRDKFRLPGGDR